MDFELTSSQQDLQDSARRLLAEYTTADVRRAEASVDGFPRTLWDAGSVLGWPGLSLAAESGGGGRGLLDQCVLLEEIGRAGASLPLVASAGVAATVLQRAPQGAHRDRLLRTIANGGIVAPALIDEQARNEWDAVRLPLQVDGDRFRLSGTKVLVPFAAVADDLLVTATVDGDPTVVAVDVAADGVSIAPHHAKVGVPLAAVRFDDVLVKPDRIIDRGVDAAATVDAALQVGSLLSTAEAIGFCEALIALTAEHVTRREAFGRPIGTFQAVAHPCADMRVSADAIRILVQQAAWLLDTGGAADEEIPATKALANELFETVANDAFRLHGALGFSNECDVQLYMRRMQGFFGRFGETQESFDRAAAALGL